MTRAQTKRTDWQAMPDDQQAMLAQQALRKAALIIAEQAELFAVQFQGGILCDRGSADGLKLFANLLRETTVEPLSAHGHA